MKREKGCCRQCNAKVGEGKLSHSKLCYDCALVNMLRFFNAMWELKHKRKEG